MAITVSYLNKMLTHITTDEVLYLSLHTADPQTDGRDTFFLATSQDAAAALSSDPAVFLASLEKREGLDADAIKSFVRSGPEIKLAVDAARPRATPDEPIHHGIGFRLRLPYQTPKFTAIRLNGHSLSQSPTDGFQSWRANGFTQLQINVPPEKASKQDLYLVTCEYEPDEVRTIGWVPPKEVLKQLKEQ